MDFLNHIVKYFNSGPKRQWQIPFRDQFLKVNYFHWFRTKYFVQADNMHYFKIVEINKAIVNLISGWSKRDYNKESCMPFFAP